MPVLALALACTACAPGWPDRGGGGAIESRWPMMTAANQPPQWLFDHVHCTLSKLEALRDAAARTGHHTGEMALLDNTANRLKREYAGQLFYDAQITMLDLDSGIENVNQGFTPAPAALPACN